MRRQPPVSRVSRTPTASSLTPPNSSAREARSSSHQPQSGHPPGRPGDQPRTGLPWRRARSPRERKGAVYRDADGALDISAFVMLLAATVEAASWRASTCGRCWSGTSDRCGGHCSSAVGGRRLRAVRPGLSRGVLVVRSRPVRPCDTRCPGDAGAAAGATSWSTRALCAGASGTAPPPAGPADAAVLRPDQSAAVELAVRHLKLPGHTPHHLRLWGEQDAGERRSATYDQRTGARCLPHRKLPRALEASVTHVTRRVANAAGVLATGVSTGPRRGCVQG